MKRSTDGPTEAGDDSPAAKAEGDDPLDDIFGNFDDDDASSVGGSGGNAGGQLPEGEGGGGASTPEAATFRSAFARIDSHAEAEAQRWSEDAQRAQSLLDSAGAKQSPSPEVLQKRDTDEEKESWLEWHGPSGARRLTPECVRAAVQRLKTNKASRFPAQDVVTLLGAACRGALSCDRAVRDVAVPGTGRDGGRVIVVGDTHGQLEDVLWILFKHGEPSSAHTVYLFNGDVADRGRNALEIFMLLTMYTLSDPGSIYLNRGNHEDSFLTSVYGFREECLEKYGREAGLYIYALTRELFNHLALGSVIDAGPGRRYFVVHAGVPRRGETLEDIRNVNFRREIPAPPRVGEDEVFFDCMWADPQEKPGIGPNIRGPHVATFGPDITKAFVERSGVDVVIRSHAVPSTGRGVEWHHDRKMLTVFSASNYVGTAGNMGGVAEIRRGEQIETFEHFAGPREELVRLEAHVQNASAKLRAEAVRLTERRRKRRGRAQGLEKMQIQTLDHVKERIVACKYKLFDFWTARDETGHWHVTPSVWREGMALYVGEDLPWEWVQESFEVVEPENGLVSYTRFLQRFRVAQVGEEDTVRCSPPSPSPSPKRARRSFARGWQGVVVRRLFESLLLADLHLRDTLAALDRNADGVVGLTELAAIVADCGMALSPAQCQTLMRALRMRQGSPSSALGLFQFLDTITITFSSCRRTSASADHGWVPAALGKVARVLLEDAYYYLQALNARQRRPPAPTSPGSSFAATLPPILVSGAGVGAPAAEEAQAPAPSATAVSLAEGTGTGPSLSADTVDSGGNPPAAAATTASCSAPSGGGVASEAARGVAATSNLLALRANASSSSMASPADPLAPSAEGATSPCSPVIAATTAPGSPLAGVVAASGACVGGIAASASPPPPWSQGSVAQLLAAWFRKADTDGNGYLSAAELESALEPLAPELEKRGVPSDLDSRRMIVAYLDWRGTGHVNYMELLAAMSPVEEGQDGDLGPFGEDLLETIALAIYSNRAALLCTLRERFDAQGTGTVSTTEFADALAAVSAAVLPRGSDGGVLPQAQIEAIASELSGFSSGRVEYEAFINSFRIVEGLGWSRRGSYSFDLA